MRVLAFLGGAVLTALLLAVARLVAEATSPLPSFDLSDFVDQPVDAVHADVSGSINVRSSGTAAADARTRRFRAELRAFAADLERTGKMDTRRAREIAIAAVSEAYRHGIPPALVLGVMMVENPDFLSTARSSAGAVGLMQIMPGVWLSELGPRYGWDLTDDRVNIGFGVHILAHYYHEADGDWRAALLRYNGCVRGTRTRNCFEYPNWVRRSTERYARTLCGGQGFDGCVARRLSLEFDRARSSVAN